MTKAACLLLLAGAAHVAFATCVLPPGYDTTTPGTWVAGYNQAVPTFGPRQGADIAYVVATHTGGGTLPAGQLPLPTFAVHAAVDQYNDPASACSGTAPAHTISELDGKTCKYTCPTSANIDGSCAANCFFADNAECKSSSSATFCAANDVQRMVTCLDDEWTSSSCSAWITDGDPVEQCGQDDGSGGTHAACTNAGFLCNNIVGNALSSSTTPPAWDHDVAGPKDSMDACKAACEAHTDCHQVQFIFGSSCQAYKNINAASTRGTVAQAPTHYCLTKSAVTFVDDQVNMYIENGAEMELDPSTRLYIEGTLTIANGGTLTIEDGAEVQVTCDTVGKGRVTNSGTIRIGETATTDTPAKFTVQNGVDGALTVAAGGYLNSGCSGIASLDTGAKLINNSDGQITNNGIISLRGKLTHSVHFENSGIVLNNYHAYFQQGTQFTNKAATSRLTNTRSTGYISNKGYMTQSHASTDPATNGAQTLNHGYIRVHEDNACFDTTDGSFDMSSTGTFRVEAGYASIGQTCVSARESATNVASGAGDGSAGIDCRGDVWTSTGNSCAGQLNVVNGKFHLGGTQGTKIADKGSWNIDHGGTIDMAWDSQPGHIRRRLASTSGLEGIAGLTGAGMVRLGKNGQIGLTSWIDGDAFAL